MTPASAESSPADGRRRSESLPEVLKRLGRLEVRAERVVTGFLSGRHHSPFLGRSLEFREHREYAAGDDLRHVDWKVWGRQDRLYVKQYEEETNLRAMLLVDASASMAFRGAGEAMSKHEYAATAACVLAYLLAVQHDAVGCRAFSGDGTTEAPIRTGRPQVGVIAELLEGGLEAPGPDAGADVAAVLHAAAESGPRRGLVVLISDLLCPPDELAAGLSALAAQGADVLVLQVLSDDEIDFPIEGATRFVALEGAARLDANPRALRRDYLAALARHQEAVESICSRHRADHQLLRASEPLDAALVALLSRRGRAARRR